jgi:hypothetical protein
MPNNLIQRHIPPESLSRVSVEFQEAAPLFNFIVKAIEDVESATRAKAMSGEFSGDWAYNQAYLVGQLKAFDFCKQLLTR